jgi:hypothetical protein
MKMGVLISAIPIKIEVSPTHVSFNPSSAFKAVTALRTTQLDWWRHLISFGESDCWLSRQPLDAPAQFKTNYLLIT